MGEAARGAVKTILIMFVMLAVAGCSELAHGEDRA
jgi:hypothetical protein